MSACHDQLLHGVWKLAQGMGLPSSDDSSQVPKTIVDRCDAATMLWVTDFGKQQRT